MVPFSDYVTLKNHLVQLLQAAAKQVAPQVESLQVVLEHPKAKEHGDFSTNLAMTLAKPLRASPASIAQQLIAALPDSPFVIKAECAGVGFINFFLKPDSKSSVIHDILQQKTAWAHQNLGQGQKIQVEFVSANPTGPLHVGHARGAVIGDCLCRLLKATGWQVTREFYYNDAGAQIDNLARSVQCRCLGIAPEDAAWPADGYCGDYIVDIAEAYLARLTITTQGRPAVTGQGEAQNIEAIRQFAVAYLRREQDLDLHAFGVSFDVYSLESDLYADGSVAEVVQQLIAQGHTYEQDQALWFRSTTFGDDKDRVMRKQDGSYTYFVPDVAYHRNKWQRGFQHVINEQGADHHSTISRVRAGLQALNIGIPQGWPDYLLHQMVTVTKNGEEVKISKRAGSYVTLRHLIDEAGRDATRYFLVARRPDSQVMFDITLATAQTNENPVYYIQYAHARISSILRQWEGEAESLVDADLSALQSPYEMQLVIQLSRYPETLGHASQERSPHIVAYYLKDLASDFHSYYNFEQILTQEEPVKRARLALAYATQIVLRDGLAILGVNAPETM